MRDSPESDSGLCRTCCSLKVTSERRYLWGKWRDCRWHLEVRRCARRGIWLCTHPVHTFAAFTKSQQSTFVTAAACAFRLSPDGTEAMTKWMATILGDEVDLSMLAEALTRDECRVVRRRDTFVLESSVFDRYDDSSAVHEKALEVATLLSGASMLLLGASRRFRIGAIVRLDEDGREHSYITSEPVVANVRALPASFTASKPDGSVTIHRPGDPLNEWFPLAVINAKVAAVFRIRARGPLDWDDLLRIIELIQSAGIPIDASLGAPSKAELGRLEQTANSVHALGDRARHPGRDFAAPKTPMSLNTARAVVDRLTLTWLRCLERAQENGSGETL